MQLLFVLSLLGSIFHKNFDAIIAHILTFTADECFRICIKHSYNFGHVTIMIQGNSYEFGLIGVCFSRNVY